MSAPAVFYIEAGAEPVLAFFHDAPGRQGGPAPREGYAHDEIGAPAHRGAPAPGEADRRGAGLVAVLVCPPFGWEDVCSYRARRDWAEQLAAAGHPTLRFDLPGTGDSAGSPTDPARVEAWTVAAAGAASWLQVRTGGGRVAALGIGLGGLIAWRAAAQGAPVEDLILWAVPARGRTLVRELRAFSRLEAAEFQTTGAPEEPPPPPGVTATAGFVLTDETVGDLERLDVGELELPPGTGRRALLLGRDGIGIDARLTEALERGGVPVTVAPGEGFGRMMAEPTEARAPREAIATVSSWLSQGAVSATPGDKAAAGLGRPPAPPTSERLALEQDGCRIVETPLTIEQPSGRLFGVLCRPAEETGAPLTAVFLNAGAVRRIGPNRMWVETARRWASRGVTSLRLDLEGIGDADGDAQRYTQVSELYIPELVGQVRSALDTLQARRLAPRLALVGLCSGAYWGFHCALQDERVSAAFMLNPRALIWDPQLDAVREAREAADVLASRSSWRKVLRGEVRLRTGLSVARALGRRALITLARLPRRVRALSAARRSGGDELDVALDRLRDAGKHALLVFSGAEPLHEELQSAGRLARLGRWPNVRLELLPGPGHTFRPLWMQQRVHELLDEALTAELERAHPSRGQPARATLASGPGPLS